MSHKVQMIVDFDAFRSARPADIIIAGSGTVAEANVVVEGNLLTVRREVLQLTDFEVSVLETNDFGGTKLCTFPDSNLQILGFKIDLDVVVADGITNAADIDCALGSIASTGITTGDLNDGTEYVDEYSAVGAAPAGTADAHSHDNSSPAVIFLDAASANALWLNVEVPISSDGTATFTGTIEVFYIDLGEPA